MKHKLLLSFSILFFLSGISYAGVTLPQIYPTKYYITDYGASTDSLDNSSAINRAIVAANSAGGGTVVIPAGVFLSGPLTLKSNINLYLSAGSVLRLMPYGNGNGQPKGSYPNNGTTNQYTNFIYCKNLNNIAITGTGTIDGQGAEWWPAYEANTNIKRPCVIRFAACNYILVDSITMINAPNVHLTMGQSSTMGSNATISNITVKAPQNSTNTDAIDTWYWNGIDIKNCNLSTGDDNVAIDSYSQNINIKNCNIGFGHGISVGSYTTGVYNINVDSCTFNYTDNGFRLKSARDRGGVDSIFNYSNITMNAVKYPIYITGFYPKETYPASSQTASTITATTPCFKKVRFKNITISNSTYAGIIYGVPELPMQDIEFDNVKLSATTKGLVMNYATGVKFNCSSITIPSGKGNAIISYGAAFSGIDSVSGASTACVQATVSLTTGSVLQSVRKGTAIATNTFTYGGVADTVIVSALPNGITASVNKTNKTLTISGIPTEIGSYTYLVKAYQLNGDTAAIPGKIICTVDTAYRIAYVTTPNNSGDKLILKKLTANPAFALTVINSAKANPDLSNYELVVMSPVPASSDSGFTSIKTLNKPRLLLKPFLLKNTIWNWGTAVNTADSSVTITNKTHEIFNGLSFTGTNGNELQLFSTVYTNAVTGMSSWIGSPAISALGNATNTSTANAITEIPVNTSMNGTTNTQRFIMIGLSETSTFNLTPTATELIENACWYLLGKSIPNGIKTIQQCDFKIIQYSQFLSVQSSKLIKGLDLLSISGIPVGKSVGNEITYSLQTGIYILKISTTNQVYYKKVILK